VIAAVLPAGDELRLELHPAAVTAAGRSLVAGLVDCLPRLGPRPADPAPALGRRGQEAARQGSSPPGPASIAARLWAGLSSLEPEPGPVGAVDAALVLLADHELAASTVAARVAASVRADPYAVASAGLAVVSGTLHGGASLGIEALLDEIDRADQAAAVVGARLRRGERLRGFGHRLYPDGDPRAAALLARLRATAGGSPRMQVVEALLEAAARRGLPDPNVDLALAALAHVAGMTRGAAEAIFATARTAGWIAHALEEYDRNTPIRPRALYTGPTPGS
jgi:citrate synthase